MIDLLFAVLFQAAAGPAEEAAQAPQQQAASVLTEEESESVRERRERHAIRCRDRQVMGSRIQQRVCMSRAEEEEQQRVTQEIAHEMH
ncbi:MAG: hypothetical protein AB7G05_01160, partial [Hyphomonadaceae bacterium]